MSTLWSTYIQSPRTLYLSRQLRFSDALREQYLPLLGLKDCHSLLELGCGPGALARALARWYPEMQITGIDRDSGFIRFARENVPQVSFLEGDITALPFPDSSFDAVLSNTVSEHVEPSSFYREQHRVLKPGGVCLVLCARRSISRPAPCLQEQTGLERSIWERTSAFYDELLQKNSVGAYWQDEAELPRNLERYGFRDVSTGYVLIALTPDDPACPPETAHAIFQTHHQEALDNIDSLLHLPEHPVSPEEADKMKRLANQRFETRCALYAAGQKQWDTETVLLQIVRGIR